MNVESLNNVGYFSFRMAQARVELAFILYFAKIYTVLFTLMELGLFIYKVRLFTTIIIENYSLVAVKWDASSRCLSFLYYSTRNSDDMTIGNAHSTLFLRKFPN